MEHLEVMCWRNAFALEENFWLFINALFEHQMQFCLEFLVLKKVPIRDSATIALSLVTGLGLTTVVETLRRLPAPVTLHPKSPSVCVCPVLLAHRGVETCP